ncbi:ABC-F family ATP-binding cassette domain-containing protein [soil metagenome]
MAILRLHDVRREVGDFVILDSITASIAHGERVGLVGANGAGKTTLLRIGAGIDEPDHGTVTRKRDLTLGLLGQEANLDAPFAGAPTLRAAVRAGAAAMEGMELRLRALEEAGASAVESAEYSHLREQFELAGGYSLDVRVEAALSGLGFAPADWQRSPAELSGGEQTRAALARLLVADPDLLMLDEPTNHLDVAAIEWLESTLAARSRALLVAAHDRAFLDSVVTRVWELRDRRLAFFRGNYAAYHRQRIERDARQQRDAESVRQQVEREDELIQRYRSHRKYSKMHEHERRREALAGQQVDGPSRQQQLRLGGQALLGGGPQRSGDMVVALEELHAGFPGRPVVAVPRLVATRGERVGIVGPNGAGKTTLLRTIAGELPPLDGFLRLGAGVQPGYLAQVRRAAKPGSTVLDALLAAVNVDYGPARSYLARFLFRGEDVFKPLSELSGGERSRLELALLGISPANLLLLDEPTNHLDIPAREALEAFLRETPATLLLVSHDRRLLESVCTRLWVVAPAQEGLVGPGAPPANAAPYYGGYREFRAAVADGWTVDAEIERQSRRLQPTLSAEKGRSASQSAARAEPAPQPLPARPRRPQACQRMSKDAYRRRRQTVEEELTRFGLRKSQLELALADPQVQANFVELRRVSSELADVEAALAQAEDAWLTLAEQAPR